MTTVAAEQGICDDCGTPGPVMNANTAGNPWWLCGRCMHSTHTGIYVNAHIDDNGHVVSVTTYDQFSRITISNDSAITSMPLYADQIPELIAALQVALARQEAAKGAKGDG